MPVSPGSFRHAIRVAGLNPPDSIEPGRFYRFGGKGKPKGNADGWCKLFVDGKAGIFGDWSSGMSEHWQVEREVPMTPAERVAVQRQIEQAKIEAEMYQTKAACHALAIWQAATEARADHPYLARKQVPSVVTLREIEASTVMEILGYAPRSRGQRLAGRLLVVPVKVGNRLSTLELIDEAGRKSALRDGAKKGGYWAAQALPDSDGNGLTLLLGEGVATVLSAQEASGNPALAALSAGNLPAVAKALCQRYPTAVLIILGDLVKASGEPDPHAVKAAMAVGGLLAVPDFGVDRSPAQTDFNDLHQASGLDIVRRAVAAAKVVATMPDREVASPELGTARDTDPDRTTIERLASLSALHYDRTRVAEAKSLGVRPATLDRLVAATRKQSTKDDMGMVDVDPWPDPVVPSALLTDIAASVRRFVVCDADTAHAVALWAAMTWFMDAVHVAPLAVITAPEKRCGKSLLLFVLGRLSCRPIAASSISTAALFRVVDAWYPTLLVDEADAFMRENEELRGILNAGHTRESAYVIRVVGEDFRPTRFRVWGAKALAGIGRLADTLMDRAITLELRRKRPDEEVERLRHADPALFEDLSAKLARFAEDYRDAVRRARPEIPPSLNDRAQDNWEPLLAIAEVAGAPWPQLGRRAALKLSGSDSPAMTVGTELLADIREVFETKRADRISTVELIEALCAEPEKPWATFNRGKPISPRQVSRQLGEYGIRSHTIRIGIATPKGFLASDFSEPFSRYLAVSPFASATPPQASIDADPRVADSVGCCGNKNASATPKSLVRLDCGGVADSGEGTGGIVEVEL